MTVAPIAASAAALSASTAALNAITAGNAYRMMTRAEQPAPPPQPGDATAIALLPIGLLLLIAFIAIRGLRQ